MLPTHLPGVVCYSKVALMMLLFHPVMKYFYPHLEDLVQEEHVPIHTC